MTGGCPYLDLGGLQFQIDCPGCRGDELEGSDVSERRLSSRCRSAWGQPIVLFCVGWPHARMVSLWSSSRRLCARRAVRRLSNRTKLHTHSCQRMRELAAPPALASGKRLADKWPDEWRTSPLILVVRLAVHAMPGPRAMVGPPRALPLRRCWLWARASPEFPLWRYCQ